MSLAGDFSTLDGPVDGTDFDPYLLSDPWSDNMSWPWLHETLFLQNYPDLGTPGVLTNVPSVGDTTSLSNQVWDSEAFPSANAVSTWPVPNAQNQQTMNVTTNTNGRQQNQFLSRSNQEPFMINGRPFLSTIPEVHPDSYVRKEGGDVKSYQAAARPIAPAAQSQSSKPVVPSDGSKENHEVRMTDPQQAQRAVVDDLVNFAFDFSNPTPDAATCASFWRKMSTRVEQAFDLYHVYPTRSGHHHLLHYFVDLFLEHFYPLWPMFRKHTFVHDRTTPHLFMTLASIGSMYAGKAAATYGFLTHESMRLKLIIAPFQFQLPEEAYEPLCQSMVLIQVAALYFGHKQAFSVAQQLGSIIVSHARKINLFNNTIAFQNIERQNGRTPKNDEIVSNWVRSEARKRLAFGILRAEVFVGILLNTRPLVSFEEVNLELPCSNDIWSYEPTKLEQYVLGCYNRVDERRGYLYSDLVRIALDKGEALPNLNPVEFELILFGLQQLVWRFSHDLGLMPRLTGSYGLEPKIDRQNDLFGSWSFSLQHADHPENGHRWNSLSENGLSNRADLLDSSIRDMNDLKADFARASLVLRKWKQSFAASTMATEIVNARSSLLASRLLYHLSFVRLRADIHTFHLLAHKLVKGDQNQTPIQNFVSLVYRWAASRDAKVALEHACAIWSLISSETERSSQGRAKFNIASHISLYHAAAVVWAYAGTHDTISEASLDMGETRGKSTRDEYRIHRGNNAGLMSNFAALLKKITPAWITISSFTNSLSIMASRPFPMLPALDKR
jgi:hypothetical protein